MTRSPVFAKPDKSTPLYQCDVFDSCPLIFWDCFRDDDEVIRKPKEIDCRVIVLTQSCDLANQKTTRVQLAVVHETQFLVAQGVLKSKTIRDNVRLHKVFGWYFLEQSEFLPESIVDFRDLHTISRLLLEDLVTRDQRICTMVSPYREHLAKHFADTYSRVALPAPPKTVD
jgi:hypothetical protein